MNNVKVLYCTRMCTEETFRDLFKDNGHKPAQQMQKYHRILFQGLYSLDNTFVKAYSSLPLNRNNYRHFYRKGGRDPYDDKILYISSFNLPIIRNLSQIWGGKNVIRRNNDSKCVCIIDVLNVSYNTGIVKACKKSKIPIVGIVTDLPEILFSDMRAWVRKKAQEIIKGCDAYVFLTHPMNVVVNHQKKPYIVIEGQVDERMKNVSNNFEDKDDPAVVLYSGSIHRIHGIENLVKGFIEANIDNTELHIYGEGDYAAELRSVCKLHPTVRYYGVKLIDEVIKAQIRATLLVNPRPTNQEFVKYSFPSKTMEYMASGTPLLTTELPGMPDEYKEFVYLLKDESIDGICLMLKNVLGMSRIELHEKGRNAKEFVIENKSGRVQAGKIMELATSIRNIENNKENRSDSKIPSKKNKF